MSASPYLLFVNSKPTAVSDAVWRDWHISEHLPDLVNAKASTHATFLEEIPFPYNPKPEHPSKFLALYHTDFEEPVKTEEYAKTRKTSELFKKEGNGIKIGDNGEINARNYELIQEFDPKGTEPPPEILTVEFYPADVDDFDAWCREEHLPLLSKIPGHRRSLRYRLGPRTPLTKGDDPPTYLTIHEVDDVSIAFGSDEATAASATEWSKKQIGASKFMAARAWKGLHQEGY